MIRMSAEMRKARVISASLSEARVGEHSAVPPANAGPPILRHPHRTSSISTLRLTQYASAVGLVTRPSIKAAHLGEPGFSQDFFLADQMPLGRRHGVTLAHWWPKR